MIALFLLQAGVTPLGAIGRQALPAQGCAAYLWSTETAPQLVARAGADPAMLRVSLDGHETDLPSTARSGTPAYGFAETTTYAAGGTSLTLDMTIVPQTDLTQGAAVPRATLLIERAGRDSVVVPVAGLIGCAP